MFIFEKAGDFKDRFSISWIFICLRAFIPRQGPGSPHTLGVSLSPSQSATTSPVVYFEANFSVSPMGTEERSPFIRFSSGPSQKYHLAGKDSARGILPVCVHSPWVCSCGGWGGHLRATSHPKTGSWGLEQQAHRASSTREIGNRTYLS